MRTAAAAALVLTMLSCSPELPPMPDVDLTSPDNVVKSLWRLRDWQEQRHYADSNTSLAFPVYTTKAKQRLQKKRQESADRPAHSEVNRIEKVDIESSTRAIVWSMEHDAPGISSEPREVHYVLTSVQGDWVIEDVETKCSLCNGSGVISDLEQRLKDLNDGVYDSDPKKPCDYCKGDGRFSPIYD